jgi:hypothetical protein
MRAIGGSASRIEHRALAGLPKRRLSFLRRRMLYEELTAEIRLRRLAAPAPAARLPPRPPFPRSCANA